MAVPPPGSHGWYALGGPVRRAGCCYGLGAFTPDGRMLAVYARVAGPAAPGLAVVDVARGLAALLPGSQGAVPGGRLPCLAWASNGWLLLASSSARRSCSVRRMAPPCSLPVATTPAGRKPG
jgi:hypothetical protein